MGKIGFFGRRTEADTEERCIFEGRESEEEKAALSLLITF